jgi:nitroimidazol reductase NimA-like FMN-containing flavoprotein (pyridoxamine 5'-phosphate oxidase superfamily)
MILIEYRHYECRGGIFMRRKECEVTIREELEKIMNSCKVCRVAMHDGKECYIVPLNFGYTYEGEDLVLYFHGAREGRKIDVISKYPQVGFEMDCDHKLIVGDIPCTYSYAYASIIGSGKAEIIEDPKDKVDAMQRIMVHQTGKEFELYETMVKGIAVFKINVEKYTGKKR